MNWNSGFISDGPEQVGEALGRQPSAEDGRAAADSRSARSACDGGRPSACRRRARRLGRPCASAAAPAAAAPAAAAAAAPCSGAVSKTKKRTAGFSVDPISALRILEADGAAETREALAGDVVDERRRVLHAHTIAGCRRRGRDRASGSRRRQRRQRRRRRAADELRLRPGRLQRFRRVRAVVLRPRATACVAPRRRCRSALTRRSGRPRRVLNRLAGSAGSSPSMRRAPRDSQLRAAARR